MFIDTAKLLVIAGRGGDGSMSFRREKYIPAGGPDGGDGGNGGNIVLVVDEHMSTLSDYRYKHKFVAENGVNGGGRRFNGRNGQDLVLRVPKGTVVRDAETRAVIHDMSDNEPYVLAKGGRGGWGNKHFATPTRQAHHFARPGLPGQQMDIILELKLLADVGLVGFPNAGKSTLLSVISNAKPKIAGYPFTTLNPCLGVVTASSGESFVAADIPGLIEGASAGIGLGHDFLRHVDRCRLLLHVVDVAGIDGRDPVDDFEKINIELKEYSPNLAERPQIVVANKCDSVESREPIEALKAKAEELGMEFCEISAAGRVGIQELIDITAKHLATLPPIVIYEEEYVAPLPEAGSADDVLITRVDDVYLLTGTWLERLVSRVNFSDDESRMYFDRQLRNAGIFDRLEQEGIQEGDTVCLYDLEFEYVK